jgi:hypothetical protein
MDSGLISRKERGSYEKLPRVDRYLDLLTRVGLDLDRQIQIRRLKVDRAEGGGAWRRRRGWRRRSSTALTEITIPATISTWVGPGSELGDGEHD